MKSKQWVVVHVDSTNLNPIKEYAKHGTARSFALKTPGTKVMSREYWADKRDEKVTVVALMTGKAVDIRRADLGGPCDPSTEHYYSM